jgi:hypothetical protein
MNILVHSLHLATAISAGAPTSIQQDGPWSAWRGCWQAEGAPANEIVCIADANGGVRISTFVAGEVREESRIVADGVGRPIQEQGCTGTERAQWSSDGLRVFLDSEVTCGGAARRVVRGMFAFVAPDEWISVQTAIEGDSIATRAVRFAAVEAARLPAGANSFASRNIYPAALLAVDEADVSEAVEKIGALAAQEWMSAAGTPFEVRYGNQNRGAASALEQVGRMSNPVVIRDVVHVVERPVYVYHPYVTDNYYHWRYSPWGHYRYGWRWLHRPLVVLHLPIIIHRNSGYHRDYWRYRNHHSRRDRDDDNDWRGGRATRSGYTSGRERAAPDRARSDTRETPARSSVPRAAVTRTSTPRASAPANAARTSAPRSSAAAPRTSTPARGVVSRTAKARSSNARD